MLWTAVSLLLAAAARAGEVTVRVVDAAGKPVEGAVVYLDEPSAEKFSGEAVMDQVGLEFEPHALVVRAGTAVRFPNKDHVQHEIYSFSKAKRFELPLAQDTAAEPVVFETPGVVRLGCNIHDWMTGYVLVVPNGAHAATGPDGTARLSLPDGPRRLAVWSERVKGEPLQRRVESGSKPVSLTVSVKAGPPFRPRSRAGSASQYR